MHGPTSRSGVRAGCTGRGKRTESCTPSVPLAHLSRATRPPANRMTRPIDRHWRTEGVLWMHRSMCIPARTRRIRASNDGYPLTDAPLRPGGSAWIRAPIPCVGAPIDTHSRTAATRRLPHRHASEHGYNAAARPSACIRTRIRRGGALIAMHPCTDRPAAARRLLKEALEERGTGRLVHVDDHALAAPAAPPPYKWQFS